MFAFPKVGMTLVVDHSGKVFGKKKPTLKDLQINHEDWESKTKMVSQSKYSHHMHDVQTRT